MNRFKLCLYQGIIEMTLLIFFLYFQFYKQGNPIPTIKQKMNSIKHKLSFNLNQPLVSLNMTSVPLKTSISSIHQTTNCSSDHFSIVSLCLLEFIKDSLCLLEFIFCFIVGIGFPCLENWK